MGVLSEHGFDTKRLIDGSQIDRTWSFDREQIKNRPEIIYAISHIFGILEKRHLAYIRRFRIGTLAAKGLINRDCKISGPIETEIGISLIFEGQAPLVPPQIYMFLFDVGYRQVRSGQGVTNSINHPLREPRAIKPAFEIFGQIFYKEKRSVLIYRTVIGVDQ